MVAAINVQMSPPSTFIEFYERNAETLLLFFTRRTLDVEVALDLTAETFAQSWRGWPRVRLDSVEEVQGWMFTIARRQLGRYLRRGQVERRALSQLGLSVPELAEDEIADIEHAAELDAVRSALSVELEKLNSDQRQAVQLRIVEELSYPEVARRLGTTEPTARARVSRGLRTLAVALEPTFAHQRSTP